MGKLISMLFDRYFIKQPRLRRAVTQLRFGRSDTIADVFDLKLDINSEMENGYLRASRLSRRSSLLRDEVSVLLNLCALLEDGDTFVDIGANAGVFSSVMARAGRARRGISVHAFEADPKTASRLFRNAERHGFKAVNAAIGESASSAQFVRGATSHITARIDHKSVHSIPGETFAVECRTLSSFDLPGASLILKIDVEGMELEVLQGAWSIIDRVKAVYFDGMERQREIREMLGRQGFEFLDGRTLSPATGDVFSLLAVKKKGS